MKKLLFMFSLFLLSSCSIRHNDEVTPIDNNTPPKCIIVEHESLHDKLNGSVKVKRIYRRIYCLKNDQ